MDLIAVEKTQIQYVEPFRKKPEYQDFTITLEGADIVFYKQIKEKHRYHMASIKLERYGEMTRAIPDDKQEKTFELVTEKGNILIIFSSYTPFIHWLTYLGLHMKIKGTYGYPLRIACLKSGWRYPIPLFRSIQYLRYNNAIKTEGLFRISPNADEKNYVTKIMNSDMHSGFIDFKTITIASAVCKDYLSKLPDSLIPHESYSKFLEIGRISDKKEMLMELRKFVDHLPLINQQCLWYIIDFLFLVQSHHKDNKMTAKNLAVCFTPSCVRNPALDPLQAMTDQKDLQIAFETMIEYYNKVFKNVKQINETISY